MAKKQCTPIFKEQTITWLGNQINSVYGKNKTNKLHNETKV